MELFKGKSASERNKIIAAAVLGVLAFAALVYAFVPGLFSRGTTSVTVATPTPKTTGSPSKELTEVRMPTSDEQLFDYTTTPVVYSGDRFMAPDPGRNIFAFYEPPPPTPWSPTPYVAPPIKPTPTPRPNDYLIGFVMPQTVYAGSRGFRLEVNGDLFTPDAKIYFSQVLLPTNFVSAQRLTADVPANLLGGPGPRQVIVQSLDGTKYSQQLMFNVQPQPKPQMLYIGMVSRKFANNDTAYFIEQNKLNTPGAAPQTKRLNDIIEGRFKLVSIAKDQVIVEDVSLGFRHPIGLYTPTSGTTVNTRAPSGFPIGGFPMVVQPGSAAGFPAVSMPRTIPNTNSNRVPRNERETKADVDDDDPK